MFLGLTTYSKQVDQDLQELAKKTKECRRETHPFHSRKGCLSLSRVRHEASLASHVDDLHESRRGLALLIRQTNLRSDIAGHTDLGLQWMVLFVGALKVGRSQCGSMMDGSGFHPQYGNRHAHWCEHCWAYCSMASFGRHLARHDSLVVPPRVRPPGPTILRLLSISLYYEVRV